MGEVQVRAAGGEPGALEVDGVDQWATLTKGTPSPRVEMLYNIDPINDDGNGPGGAIRLGSPPNPPQAWTV